MFSPPCRIGALILAFLYVTLSVAFGIELTPAEQAFVAKHPSWNLMGSSAPPFQWTDEDGHFQGIAADYRAIIEKRLGVTLHPVPASSWAESLDQLRRRECDVSLLTAGSPERDPYLTISKPLLVLNPVVITRRDNQRVKELADLNGRIVAVPRDWVVHERLKRDYPGITLLPRDDVASGVAAVAVGDAEAFFGDLFSASYAIDRLGLNNLKVAAESKETVEFAIAVRKDWPEAVTILDKVIDSITSEEHAKIRRRWIAMGGSGLTWTRVVTFAAPVLIIAAIIVLLLVNRRLAREVAQRAVTESALRESDERWSFALEGSRDGVWDWNVKTNEVFFSKQWKTMLGFTDEELSNHLEEWSSRIHPDDLDAALDTVQRHVRGEIPFYQVEHRVRHKDGGYRWILARGRVVSRDDAGYPQRMVGTHVDVTEWKKAEDDLKQHRERLEDTVATRTAELREAEHKLREMTDNIPGAVYQFAMSRDGRFSFPFCSEGMEEMVGVSSDEAVRDVNTVLSVIHPEDLEVLVQRAHHSSATLTRYVQDLRICQRGGQNWWIRAEADPTRKPDGSTLWNGNIMDITERKRLEEELALAKSAAESANKAKSSFLANMSHEIRTPMNAILGFSQLLFRDPQLTPTQRQHLETINRGGEHLLGLINDILEMSKIEAGHVTVHPVDFDFLALLDDLERMFRLRTDARHLNFKVERLGQVPRFLHTDESKLRQIFINLIGNAVKFTEQGGITVRVGAEKTGDDSVRVFGEVEDTGPGIADDEIPKLFQQFEQTTTGHQLGTGTGLGLAISREFVRLMKGDINVVSRIGIGTTFSFHVVAGPGDEIAAVSPGTEPNSQRVVGLLSPLSPVRILIADDKVENRNLLQQLLQPIGYETCAAFDGRQAIEITADWQPNVILIDLRMPVMDGLEATRRIRALPNGSSFAIIAVTASVFEEDRRKALDAGADDFLRKPFREAELFEKIADLAGVTYRYAEDPSAVALPGQNGTITSEEVSQAVPEQTRHRLVNAVICANFDEMLEIIAKIDRDAPQIAHELRLKVERYEYQDLLALLKQETIPA